VPRLAFPNDAVQRRPQDDSAGLARDSAPGLAIAVARGDSILWEEGFGWADQAHPITVNTPFYLSVTKTITATALMVLREQGRLGLTTRKRIPSRIKTLEPALEYGLGHGASTRHAPGRCYHVRPRLPHGDTPGFAAENSWYPAESLSVTVLENTSQPGSPGNTAELDAAVVLTTMQDKWAMHQTPAS
jgi:hypothetical protein